MSHTESHPRAWWIAANAECEYRIEEAPRIMRRLLHFYCEDPEHSTYNAARPLDAVLGAATRGMSAMEFWGSHLRDKATKWEKGYGDSLQS